MSDGPTSALVAPGVRPGEQSDVLLHLENVGRTFHVGEVSVEVLKEINLDVRSRELLIMVGPSGSGKTTLLNIMGGLDSPNVGHVWYRGLDLAAAKPSALAKYRKETIGFVFQFYNLVPSLTARENVMVAAEISRSPRNVDEVLDLVGLTERRDHFPSQMSGGEQQRVAIARALAKNPELLLCDEPTGALDFETGKRVLRLLVDVKDKLGQTVLVITHNAALAAAGDRIVRLRSGQIVELRENKEPVPPEEISW